MLEGGEIGGLVAPLIPPLLLWLMVDDDKEEGDEGDGEDDESLTLRSENVDLPLLFKISFTERTLGFSNLSIPNLISDGFTRSFLFDSGGTGLGVRWSSFEEESSEDVTLILILLLLFVTLGLLLLCRDDSELEESSDLGEASRDDVIDEDDDDEVEGGEHKATGPIDAGRSGIRSFHAFK